MTDLLAPARKPVNIEDEMRRSYMEYAMSVIVGRALPDVRDGLKPVHRRVLYAMYELRNFWNTAYKKSARVVGEVIGKYHPHGDAAVYDTIVRLAQTFSMRYPLVDGQGNFGSVDGDPPAAMRYTEVRLARIASEILADIDKNTVDFVPNYDGNETEPTLMPTRVPTLLVNGSAGIAVGMATNIPPHNLGEIIDATIHLIRHPEATLQDLMQYVKGPDFPTAGFICGSNGIREAYAGGRGSIVMRARCAVEKLKRGGDREAIIVSEIPYQVNKARLVEKIADLVKEKEVEGISDLRDESDRDGMRVVIELKRDAVADVVLNHLYKRTQLQESFGIIMLALDDGRPAVLGLKPMLSRFIDHRRNVVLRRTRFELAKAKAREHILEGFIIALDNIDEVIAIIKASRTALDAREALCARFGLSEIQSQQILDMRLQRLTGLEREKIEAELREVRELIRFLQSILDSDSVLTDVIVKELGEIREQYADARRTEIVGELGEFKALEFVKEEDQVVTVSHQGYIKRTSLTEYRAQRRGGRGKAAVNPKEDDFVREIFIGNTHSTTLVFTHGGRCYWIRNYEIPEAAPQARGKPIVNLIAVEPGDGPAAVVSVDSFDEERYVLFCTKAGVVKKTSLAEYANMRTAGVNAIVIDEGDEIIAAELTDGKQNVLIATAQGMSIRFPEEQVRPMGRVARGVKGIELEPGDRVVGMCVLRPDAAVLSFTQRGIGKRTELDEYRSQHRGGKGIITLKVTDKTGPVVGIEQVVDADQLMLITDQGVLIRIGAGTIRLAGRNTQGVRLIDVGEGQKLVAVARVADTGEAEADTGEADPEADNNPPAAVADGTGDAAVEPGEPGAG